MGVRREDAWSYCVIGCNELGIPGRCADAACATAGTVQYLGLLNATLEQPDLARVTGMPELLSAIEQMMAVRVSRMREWGAGYRARVAAEAPTPFTSALMHGCVELGRDMLTGMQYRFSGVYERGLTNAANALAAIDELVFHRHELSLPQLVGNMEANWADTDLLSRVRAAPKWGNDDDADRWALELVRMRERVLDEVDRASGTPPHVVCHVVRSLHHVDGKRLSASADGRRSGEPLADSIGAQAGTARCGPTAVVRSVLKLNASGDYKGGYNLNLTLPLGTGEDSIQALLETFFASGGQELQVACLDPDLLRAARRFPELHGDLLVRVAGFTARFVDLSRAEQDELMSRADAVAR